LSTFYWTQTTEWEKRPKRSFNNKTKTFGKGRKRKSFWLAAFLLSNSMDFHYYFIFFLLPAFATEKTNETCLEPVS
jgi:hypothetical protein